MIQLDLCSGLKPKARCWWMISTTMSDEWYQKISTSQGRFRDWNTQNIVNSEGSSEVLRCLCIDPEMKMNPKCICRWLCNLYVLVRNYSRGQKVAFPMNACTTESMPEMSCGSLWCQSIQYILLLRYQLDGWGWKRSNTSFFHKL